MIKSSDPHLSNTYRIIRVLSTHDYLATDHLRSHFIFSHLQTSESSPSDLHAAHHQFLLTHTEIIDIDNMQYAVFPVGAKEVTWAPLLPGKKMEGQKFVWKLLRQACEGILKELLWMGSMQARKYMNLKNFWVVGDELKVLLLPRNIPPKFTIKKSEARSTSGDKSLDHLMQVERSLMKEFALIIWQILFQSSYYESHNVTAHARSRHLLRQMVSRGISFEELCLQLSKQSFETIYNKKARLKSFQKDLIPRRKTVSYIDHSKYSTQSLNNFRLNANTQTVKRPYNTIQKQQSVIKQPKMFENEPKTEQMRSSSVENASNNNSIIFRKSRYFPKPFQSSSKETIHFERWLQSRRYSVQTRQKLIRNGQIARKKYSQAIEFRREVGKEEKFDDTGFKERILSKVIKFKNAIQQKKTHVSSIEQTINHDETQNNEDVATIQTQKIPNISLKEHRIQQNKEQSCLKSVQDQTSRGEPILPKYIVKKQPQVKEEIKVGKDQIWTKKQEPKQPQISSIKTQKKRLNRVDAITTATQIEEDLQEIKLPEPKLVMPPQKKQPSRQEETKQKIDKQQPNQQTKQQSTKQQSPLPQSLPAKSNTNSQKLVNSRDAVGQMLLLVNTLGDMTVRAVKLKDKLNDLNWRQITYFIYERFHYERERIAECLSRGKIVCRAHRRVDEKQWQQYLQREREEALSQMRKENQQITATLQRLGQKLLQEQNLQRKIQYFVRNRQKIKKDSKLRGQLSRFLVSSLVSEFDFVWEERVDREEILNFMTDCSFGMLVIGEMDSILPADKFVRLQDYKQYDKTLAELKPSFDCIDAAYFPKESQWEVL